MVVNATYLISLNQARQGRVHECNSELKRQATTGGISGYGVAWKSRRALCELTQDKPAKSWL
ncbi:hypothetical protein [Paraburkholderia oxyphila]|uniref:hypothetical protein n=1 Tax=Paraburkholderia oxyphila TaxID=614212 RepID=UPI0004825DF7|nr:hypothetical protein [Paraburkholderia oxyphila]